MNSAGELFIAVTGSHCVRRVNAAADNITTVAGVCGAAAGDGAEGAATAAQLSNPTGVALSSDGATLYITDTGNNKVRILHSAPHGKQCCTTLLLRVSKGLNPELFARCSFASWHTCTTSTWLSKCAACDVFSTGECEEVRATCAPYEGPLCRSISTLELTCCDPLVAGLQVRRVVLSSGLLYNFAGTGTGGSSGDGAAATSATLSAPAAVAVAANGDVYILDR